MIYMFNIEDNDYLWNIESNQLVKYKDGGSLAIGCNSSVQVAYPIPLNEDVLEAIGFKSNGNAEYVYGERRFVVKMDCAKPGSILQIDGNPIRYVSDLQNFCRTKGNELYIDETKLADACKNFPCKPQP